MLLNGRYADRRSWYRYRRRTRDADLERELRDHLELEADEQRVAGLSPEQAANAAHRALGNTLKIEEDVRSAWGFQCLETLIQDLRFALRMLRKSPGFTVVAVPTLAVGISANTAIFPIVNGVLPRPLEFPRSHRLMRITNPYPEGAFLAMCSDLHTMDVATLNSTTLVVRGGVAARLSPESRSYSI